MPALADTTIRLLGQEPLAGRLPTAEQLRIAEILDRAGYAYLEVSGGGCFDSAVRRGVESPWERIRALRAHVKTPLGLALRGRFLVGSRPVDNDFIRRFIACAAENGIDVFRLHDPLNDVSNLREAADAVARAGGEFEPGLVYSPGRTGETDPLMKQAAELPNLGAARVLLHDPTGSLQPHRARELVTGLREVTGLPVGIYCQGSGGNALAAALEAGRAGADLIACAVYPIALTLHRVSGEALAEALAGLGLECDIDVSALWEASDVVDEHIGDEPVTPLAPRIAVRAAQHDLPASLVAALDTNLRAQAAGARLDERTGARLAGAAERSLREPLLSGRGRAALARRRSSRHATGPNREIDRAHRLAHRRSGVRGGCNRAAAAGGSGSSRRPRLERRGVAATRPLRRQRGTAAPHDPRPLVGRRVAGCRRCRSGAGGKDPRARAHRAGDGDR